MEISFFFIYLKYIGYLLKTGFTRKNAGLTKRPTTEQLWNDMTFEFYDFRFPSDRGDRDCFIGNLHNVGRDSR